MPDFWGAVIGIASVVLIAYIVVYAEDMENIR